MMKKILHLLAKCPILMLVSYITFERKHQTIARPYEGTAEN